MNVEENKAIEWLKYLQETREEQIKQQAWVGTNTFDAIDIVLNLIDKQQEEIGEWGEIADNILRATNDYGNITIGEIPEYIERQQKEIEEIRTAPKYMFTIIYKNKDSDGCCRGEEYKVSLIAETLEQAKIKLNKIEPDKYDAIKTILKWSAVEILEEEPSELNDWMKQYNEYYLRSLKEFKEKGE